MNCVAYTEKKDLMPPMATELREALHRLKAQPVSFEADVDIQHEGDRPDCVYVVKSGWLYSYSILGDGQRQIMYLHKAGDIAGFVGLSGARAHCSLRSLGDCVVHPIPIAAFDAPSFLTPDISRFFLLKSAEMQAVLMRSLVAVGRLGARERIVWLLLMLHDRMGLTPARDTIELPLNQSELGDLIGLTNVSVSKNLCQLSTEGFIERKGSKIVLRRYRDLQRMIGYEPLERPSEIMFDGAELAVDAHGKPGQPRRYALTRT